MKTAPNRIKVSLEARTFLLLSITLAFHMFSAGFEIGAYGELLYLHKITVWSLVTGALAALTLLPRKETGITYRQLLVLLIPSLWVILESYFGTQNQGEIVKPGLFILALVSHLVCLPYAIFIVLDIVNPDLFMLKGYQPKIRAVALALLFLGAGYFSGLYNYEIMSCRDFELAGSMQPENCRAATVE